MFTGIIEETGAVESLERLETGARLKVLAQRVLSDLEVGASIAVNGACLTAVEITPATFTADLSPETLERTNLGALEAGSRVNLERPLQPGGRLSGHFVLGHVDGAGEFLALDSVGEDNWWLRIRVPPELLRYFVYKGSVAIDGISLTIASIEQDVIGVAIIPHTYRETSLGSLRAGMKVNLEADMIAKHIEKLLSSLDLSPKSSLRIEDLKEQGF